MTWVEDVNIVRVMLDASTIMSFAIGFVAGVLTLATALYALVRFRRRSVDAETEPTGAKTIQFRARQVIVVDEESNWDGYGTLTLEDPINPSNEPKVLLNGEPVKASYDSDLSSFSRRGFGVLVLPNKLVFAKPLKAGDLVQVIR